MQEIGTLKLQDETKQQIVLQTKQKPVLKLVTHTDALSYVLSPTPMAKTGRSCKGWAK